jgi:hypothetical protein
MTEVKVVAPKRGDHVGTSNHPGAFEVVGVNALMQAANIRALDGSGPVIPNIPWVELKPLKK